MTALATSTSHRLSFDLPPDLEAGEPPEARGLTRDAVRMLVAHRGDARLVHSTFALLPVFLEPGDLVVINTSGTIPAAIDAVTPTGEALVVHLSTQLAGNRWVLEPRRPAGRSTERLGDAPPNHLSLAGGAALTLCGPYRDSDRLFVGQLDLPQPVFTWLAVHGRPIRYRYVEKPWPVSAYQNVYVTEPGSAEMPSAGRPFTPDVITRLVAKGIAVSPIVLHTGVASLEADELPYPEHAMVPRFTAERVNATGDRRRHNRCPRARISDGPRRCRAALRRLDRRCDHARTRRTRGGRSAHWLARTRSVPPPDARSGRGPRTARNVVRSEPRRRLPLARVRRRAPDPAVKPTGIVGGRAGLRSV
jgi:S-adenosylmethionine:tRNA-ribosyltransferase-isomerase (queuine synthetase)